MPTGSVIGQFTVRIVHLNLVIALNLLVENDDIDAVWIGHARKDNARVARAQNQITENPRRGLDMQVELQMSPIFLPAMPEFIPRIPVPQLSEIDEILQRHRVGTYRAGRQEGDVCWYSRNAVASSSAR